MELQKKNGIKNLLKSILFVVVFSLTLIPVNRIFTPNWTYNVDTEETGEGNRYRDFYSMDDKSLDYLVLGVSHAFYSINPMQIYAETGCRGFVLAGGFQPQTCSYYWLREACKYQHPKVVFIDVSSLIKDFHRDESNLKSLLAMHFSPLKLEAIRNCSPDDNVRYSALFPLYSFHDRWQELKKEDYLGSEEEKWYYLKGAALRFITKSDSLAFEAGSTDPLELSLGADGVIDATREKLEISPLEKEYFEKTYSYCKENNIRLVPVKCPTRAWNDEWSGVVSDYVESLGLELLDLHDGADQGIEWKKDTFDNGRHTNYYGSFKTSGYLANYLKKDMQLPDHRNDSGSATERWNSDLKEYRDWERENVLGRMNPMGQVYGYLSRLAVNRDRYLILITGKKDVSALSDDLADSLYRQIGMEEGLDAAPHESYIAVIDGGKPVISYGNERRIKYSLESEGIGTLVITSSGDTSGYACGVELNGEELSFSERGLNFVIFDKMDGMPLNRAYYGYDEDEKLCFRSESLSSEAADRWNASPVIPEGDYDLSMETNKDRRIKVKVEASGNDAFSISDRDTMLSLTPDMGADSKGAEAGFSGVSGLADESFYIIPSEKGGYGLYSLYNGLMLSSDGGSLKFQDYSGTYSEVFLLRKADK